MRLRRPTILIAVVAIALAACSDDAAPETTLPATTAAPATTTTTEPAPPTTTTTTTVPVVVDIDPDVAAVLEAAFANAASGSWRAEGTWLVTGDLDGSGTTTTAEIAYVGAFDATTGDSLSLLDLSELGGLGAAAGQDVPPDLAGALTAFETRVVGGVAYLRFPLFGMMLGVTTEWISVPEEDSSSATGLIPFAAFGDVATALGGLRDGLVGAEEVGREQVDGVDATRYALLVDAARLDAGVELPAGAQSIDVWIDDEGNLRRYVIDIDAPELDAAAGATAERVVIAIDFVDIGEPIVIEAPDAAEVTDVAQLFAGPTP